MEIRWLISQHRLGTELGVIFACCYNLPLNTGDALPPDVLVLDAKNPAQRREP